MEDNIINDGYVKIRPGDGRVYAFSQEFLMGDDYDDLRVWAHNEEIRKRQEERNKKRQEIQKGADIILNRLTIDYGIYKQNLKREEIRRDSHLGIIDDLDIDVEQIKSRFIAKELMYNLFYEDPRYFVFDPRAIMFKS